MRWDQYLRLYVRGLQKYVLEEKVQEDSEGRIDLITEKREYEAGSLRRTRLGSAFMLLGDLRWAYNKSAAKSGGWLKEKERKLWEDVWGNEMVKDAVKDAVSRVDGADVERVWKEEEATVKAMLAQMKAELSPPVIQSLAYVFRKVPQLS